MAEASPTRPRMLIGAVFLPEGEIHTPISPPKNDSESELSFDIFASTENSDKTENQTKSTQTEDAVFSMSMSTVIQSYDMLNRRRCEVCAI